VLIETLGTCLARNLTKARWQGRGGAMVRGMEIVGESGRGMGIKLKECDGKRPLR
jgi:hypothetical protein